MVTGPAMGAQMYDYQQYKTGERQEGTVQQCNVILGTIFFSALAFVHPAITEYFGYVDDVTELYKPEVIVPIIRTLAIFSAVSGVLSAIPFLFWDLSEAKHERIMDALRIRAAALDGAIETAAAKEYEDKVMRGEITYKQIIGSRE